MANCLNLIIKIYIYNYVKHGGYVDAYNINVVTNHSNTLFGDCTSLSFVTISRRP